MRKLVVMVLAFALLAAAVFAFLPAIIEALLNRVQWRPPYPAPDWALAVAADEVDLHADPLLWGRDLLERGSRGHVDLPRLLEVGALLQVFGVVTQAPLGMNVTRNPNDAADMITGLAIVSRWPRQTWKSRRERALYLAQRLRETAARSAGKLVLVRWRADRHRVLEGGHLRHRRGRHRARDAPRRRRDGRRARRAGKRFRRGGQAALRRHGSSAPRRGPPRRTLQRCAGPSHLHRQCRRILVEVTALTVYCARLA